MSAAALPRRSTSEPRQLERCLLLAVLLHIWLVLIFGNATGSAAAGQGVWGSLTVKLRGRSGDRADMPPGDATAASGDAPAGAGGRPSQAGPREPIGAAKQGRWNPQDVPPEAARSEELSTAAANTATLDLPEGFRPVERENLAPLPPRLPVADPSVMPLRPAELSRPVRAAATPPTAELPAAIGRLEARPDAAAAAAPLAPATSLRATVRAAELPPRADELPAQVRRLDSAPPSADTAALPSPAALRAAPPPAVSAAGADLPPPVRRLEAEAAVGASLPRAADLRSAAPATAAPPAAETTVPAAVQRLESSAQSVGASALTPASELRPSGPAAHTPRSLPGAGHLPAAVKRMDAGDAAGTVTSMRPAAPARVDATAPAGAALSDLAGALPGTVSAPAGPAQGDPNASPFAAPRASTGSPDAGPRVGAEPAQPPSAAASVASRPPLNLSLPRGDIAARRGPGLIDLLPQPPERKSKLEQSIEDAVNKDCRKAYSNAGILAAVPLAIDAARGKGCKW